MKFWSLGVCAAVLLVGPAAARAEEPPAAEAPVPAELSAVPADEVVTTAAGRRIVLGPIGFDAQGRKGRLHTVVPGNTLWDISSAYLGTPWVWPSVWIENEDIANPHRIYPDELIWITSNEMRRVSPAEAQELLVDEPPAAPAPREIQAPAALDQVAVNVPLGDGAGAGSGATVHISDREGMSFVSREALDAATSIVDSPSPRTWIVEGDVVYLGLGEGEVEPGARFTVFRDAEPVRGLDGNLLGYHIRVLGWVEVESTEGETSIGRIRRSVSEMKRGDRMLPREAPPLELALSEAPTDLDGHIVHFPDNRTLAGSIDYVYLDRGALHGLEVGDALEAYAPGAVHADKVRRTRVRTPDRAVANLVVVSVQADSSVAFVAHASRELERGDLIRASAQP